MRPVFLHGALTWPPLLAAVTGQQAAPGRTRQAALAGHGVVLPCDKVVPVLAQRPDAGAQGLLLEGASGETVERLGYFLRVCGAAPVELTVSTSDGPRRAACFPADPPGADDRPFWKPKTWIAEFGPLMLDASCEIMGYRDTLDAATVAGRLPMILSRAASRRAAASGAPATLRSDCPSSDVRVHRRRVPHAGFFLTRDYELCHPRFDGAMSPPLRREVFVATDAAIVLPYDAGRDRLLMVEQFRMGPFGRGDPRPWMLEPVAGRIDAGETPEACARRECAEEAGIVLDKLEPVANYYCSPGYSTEYFHCFVGLCDLPSMSPGRGGLPGEHEDIRTHVLTFDSAMHLLDTGEVDNGPLILSLLWLERARARLRAAA